MKQLTQRFTPFLIILALMLPWATAEALETFEGGGIITSVGYEQFTLGKQTYRIAAKATLKSGDASRSKISDLKQGDRVYIKGTILNDVYYVDKIIYYIPIAS